MLDVGVAVPQLPADCLGNIDQNRLSARRDVGAAKAFFRQASGPRDRLQRPSHWTVTRRRIAPCVR
jgi:hypothetical protein